MFVYSKPFFIFGNSIILRTDSKYLLLSFFYFLKNKFSILTFNLINSFLGFYSISNIIYNIKYKNIKYKGFIYNLMGINNIENNIELDNSFIVYQGFFNNYFNSNVIIPIAAPYEIDSLYLNLEGRYRLMKQVIKSFIGLYSN
jgi:hypothetical protein